MVVGQGEKLSQSGQGVAVARADGKGYGGEGDLWEVGQVDRQGQVDEGGAVARVDGQGGGQVRE
jgi:hypothetical protein